MAFVLLPVFSLLHVDEDSGRDRGDALPIAVITAEPAIQYSFCFGIIQARLSGQYNACYLINMQPL